MIWDTLKKPFLILAPMEGVTDIAFRQVVAHAGRPDLFFTEFTNVSSYASEKGRANALERLEISDTDRPIIAQIWGKNPEHFAEICQVLASLGFAGVDLNFGCPDKHVNKAGGGAAMIKTPDLAVECYQNARKSTDLPVSIKTRLGWTKVEEYKDWLTTLLNQQPVALAVHLRTKKEMSKVPAHYELIPDIVKLRNEISPETKLIINGDIKDRARALELYRKYPEIDGFMIGRGVFQNPYCFTEREPSRAELMQLLYLHLDLYEKQAAKYQLVHPGKTFSYEPLKHFYKIYINNFPGASDLRAKLMETHSVDEAKKVLQSFSEEQN